LAQDQPQQQTLGTGTESHTYGIVGVAGSIVFLSNTNSKGNASVVIFSNVTFILPLWSVTLLDGASLQILYCSAIISEQVQMRGQLYQEQKQTKHKYTSLESHPHATLIQTWNEPIGIWSHDPIVSTKPLEQVMTTRDTSDYLWYQTSVILTQDQINDGTVSVSLSNAKDYVSLFFNGSYIGSARNIDKSQTFSVNVTFYPPGIYPLSIACETVGLVNYGPFLEQWTRGLLGAITWGNTDVTNNTWLHNVGLKGESLQLWTDQGVNRVTWANYTISSPFQWYTFNLATPNPTPTPTGGTDPPVWALDMHGMGKGLVWVNGYMLGRFWSVIATGNCNSCTYIGGYSPYGNCATGCGEPSQRYYHVPKAWLKEGEGQGINRVTIWEQQSSNVNPTSVVLVQMN